MTKSSNLHLKCQTPISLANSVKRKYLPKLQIFGFPHFKTFLQYLLQLVILDVQDIDTISIWSHLVNKLEHQHNVYIMQQMTKPSNLHLIDRLQFPWLTASIVMLTNYSKILLKRLFQIFCLFCTIIQEKKDLNKGGSPSPVVMGVYSC